jgi:hypothetical protein
VPARRTGTAHRYGGPGNAPKVQKNRCNMKLAPCLLVFPVPVYDNFNEMQNRFKNTGGGPAALHLRDSTLGFPAGILFLNPGLVKKI